MSEAKIIAIGAVVLMLVMLGVIAAVGWWRERKRKRAPSVRPAHSEGSP
jgi:uncharacterized iron-regulated membrane protein